jgi:hypothetical protein
MANLDYYTIRGSFFRKFAGSHRFLNLSERSELEARFNRRTRPERFSADPMDRYSDCLLPRTCEGPVNATVDNLCRPMTKSLLRTATKTYSLESECSLVDGL